MHTTAGSCLGAVRGVRLWPSLEAILEGALVPPHLDARGGELLVELLGDGQLRAHAVREEDVAPARARARPWRMRTW